MTLRNQLSLKITDCIHFQCSYLPCSFSYCSSAPFAFKQYKCFPPVSYFLFNLFQLCKCDADNWNKGCRHSWCWPITSGSYQVWELQCWSSRPSFWLFGATGGQEQTICIFRTLRWKFICVYISNCVGFCAECIWFPAYQKSSVTIKFQVWCLTGLYSLLVLFGTLLLLIPSFVSLLFLHFFLIGDLGEVAYSRPVTSDFWVSA